MSAIVGTSPIRKDAKAKLGGAHYIDDYHFPNALHAVVVYSDISHGRLVKLNVSKAKALDGVVLVLTGRDLKDYQQAIGAIRNDQPLLATDRIRWRGDRLAIIAAHSRAVALEAAQLINAEYEEFPVVSDVEQALSKDAPILHEETNIAASMRVRNGDFNKAAKKAAHVIENRYEVGYQEHAYLEPNGIVAVPEANGSISIVGSMQCPFYVQKAIAKILGIKLSQVIVEQARTGGGFGGKEDYPNEPAACAALLAVKTNRPVKLIYSREEDIAYSTKRHAMVIYHTLAADSEGKITGMKVRVLCDAGAYLGLSAIVAERSNASAAGPYHVSNVWVDTEVIYTNNAFGGAFRGFGAPQVTFALERQMDLLAQKVQKSPLEIRLLNALQPQHKSPTGEKIGDDCLAEHVIQLAAEKSTFMKKYKDLQSDDQYYRGIGIAGMRYGVGLHAGGQHLEGSGALVQVLADGSVQVSIGGAELGQGSETAMAVIAADALGVEYERVFVLPTNTRLVPDSGPTVASRTTLMSGNAVLDACQQLNKRLVSWAAKRFKIKISECALIGGKVLHKPNKKELCDFDHLAAECYAANIHLAQSGWYTPTRKKWDVEKGLGTAYSTYAYACMVAEVQIDKRTGRVEPQTIYAIHDVGQAIHKDNLLAQVEGGVVQGMGWAIMEELVLKQGQVLNPNFSDYLIPTIKDVPAIDITLVEEPYAEGPFGAKGVGEPSLIPVAAAIANAVAHAVDKPVQHLPLTPQRVLCDVLGCQK